MALDRHFSRPAVTTDVVVFSIRAQRLAVLLVRREREPHAGMWSLPGGFVAAEEDLDASARRVLEAKTGLADVYLEQLYTFGRLDRDPRERVISVTYYALVPPGRAEPTGAARWFALDSLPALAFDHADIVSTARDRLSAKLAYSTIAFQLMPPQFTLGELQAVYEIILSESLDKRNFRKRILGLGHIAQTGEERREGNHRPARLYRVRKPGKVHIIK